jgi:hypothetical protein
MSSSGVTPRKGILDIAAYVPGKSKVPSSGPVYKLSSNETPLGPSPKARQAFVEAAEHLELYPDGGATALREAIAAHYGLAPERIVCGAGSDEILSLLAQGYLEAGDEAIHTRHGFLVYEIAIRASGATPVVAEETDLTADVDKILACVTGKTRVVFLANPNNPTGTYLPFDEVERLHGGPARAGVAGARRGLCRVCPPQRLRIRHRAGGDRRQRGDDAHLLEGLRAGGAAARLGLLPGACGRRAQPHPRAVQRQRPGDRRRGRGDQATRPSRGRRRPQREVARLAVRRSEASASR